MKRLLLHAVAAFLTLSARPLWAAELTPEQRWALGLSAITITMNGQRTDLLGGVEPTPKAAVEARQLLATWWSVKNREGLLDTLSWLRSEGHRAGFDQARLQWEDLPRAEQDEALARARGEPARRHGLECLVEASTSRAHESIIAWDLGRYVMLCGYGYVAGYLTEPEAWTQIEPVARLLQRKFKSWEAFSKNFLLGRRFWSYEEYVSSGRRAEAARSALLQDERSPWRTLAWSRPLAPDGFTP